MHRREIEGEWWTIPAERAKNKRPHRVFLTPLALELIGDSRTWIFSCGAEPMKTTAAATAVRRMVARKDGKSLDIEPFRPHDLRRTAATHLGALGYGNHLIGSLLNHTDRTVTGIYNRHAYDREKREMLERWEERLREILGIQKEED
jgi:integrase